MERYLKQIDHQEEPGVDANVLHLSLSHREQIDRHNGSRSIANHGCEAAQEAKDCRIPPAVHPSILFAKDLAPDHHNESQSQGPSHKLTELPHRHHFVHCNGHKEADYGRGQQFDHHAPIRYALIIDHGNNVRHTEHGQDDSRRLLGTKSQSHIGDNEKHKTLNASLRHAYAQSGKGEHSPLR